MTVKGIPVVDLFAGPGGLGEGFSSLAGKSGDGVFKSVVSIEMEQFAHRTLTLRHFFRSFNSDDVPEEYYGYIAGDIDREKLIDAYPEQWKAAEKSSLNIALGPDNHRLVKTKISKAIKGQSRWALVGGPPCQAYSLVGRSRMSGMKGFEKDIRHYLYREYLKIIVDHRPPVFVMENVKGLLSSKVDGELVIEKIIRDLTHPGEATPDSRNGLQYHLHSLTTKGFFDGSVDPADFVVRAEKFGVPQARHRMFIVGVRSDIDVTPSILKPSDAPTVKEVLGSLPKIRSGISRGADSPEAWRDLIDGVTAGQWFRQIERAGEEKLVAALERLVANVEKTPKRRSARTLKPAHAMTDWFGDERLRSISLHESRSHMPSDIHRYLFASTFAKVHKASPKLGDFPSGLLPRHKSADRKKNDPMFTDRFRVQLAGRVSTTVTSHISKDGHYFIHYDPVQCRSLTVREAARLQTFPDNYFFEGPRTSQYHQIGNAVPPYLAQQIAAIVQDVLKAVPED